ncbi:hypothetical protein R1sor_023879 [Riccia sorocarpa]|uniref:Trimethylguanosine synthase n=1 Tax=Riccia sorocarpa TaxID=122646 RepID=A0ABD3GP16_9MARC
MYTEKDNLCRSVSNLSKWELQNSPWWLEQRCADDDITFVADAEEICWESIKKEEDPYQVAKGKIAEADAAEQAEEAKSLKPSRKLEGLVLDTSRTKKQRDAKLKMAAKTGETKNPGSGRSSKTKSKGPKEEKARRPRRKKGEEEEVGPSHTETVPETLAETAAETAVEEATPVAESAPPEGRKAAKAAKEAEMARWTVPIRDVYHSKVEVFCKANTEFTFPKLAMDPFDPDNSGRDSAMIFNFNGQGITKLNNKCRSKCIGFVQTLLENFTTQGDIVIDFAGGWGASLFAATNCSRCCIAAETRKEAFECLLQVIKEIEATTAGKKDAVDEAGTSTAGKKSRGKKPLTEEDDLGDLLGDETLSGGDSTKRHKGRRHINISKNESPLLTPEKDYRLPAYAEDVAAKLAELPQTPSQTSVQLENENSDRMVFIDDEANVDAGSESSSAVTVYLSYDEELFKDD